MSERAGNRAQLGEIPKTPGRSELKGKHEAQQEGQAKWTEVSGFRRSGEPNTEMTVTWSTDGGM